MELTYRINTVRPTLKDGRRLIFYAAVFDVPATIKEQGRSFTEVVKPGAFRNTLATNKDIILNVDHKPDTTLSRRSEGLLLQEDGKGLFGTVWLPENERGDEIKQRVEAGDFTGCSFASYMLKQVRADGVEEVVEADLIDVCLTNTPAYVQTELALRNDNNLKNLFRRLKILQLKTT